MTRPILPAGALLLLLLASSCSLHPGADTGTFAGAGAVTVRASFRDIPLAGVRVEFRSSPAETGEAPVAAGVTNGEGIATFGIPPGRYFLVARWTKTGDLSRPVAPGDRYAWFGGNPVFVDRGAPKEIFLGLEEFPEPPSTVGEPAGGTGVAGRVVSGGVPVEGAYVFAYLRTETAFRDLGFAASAPTGPDGSFVIDLSPGNYYLLARKRAGGRIAGPMRKGDLFGYFPGNPVTVAQGQRIRIALPATSLKLRNTPAWSARYSAPASIEGRILDRSGKPVRGAYAALYDNPSLLNRPAFLSDVTGPDGKYRLPVPLPGRYYLGARSGYGGSPAAGDHYGRYEGNAEHALTIRAGDELKGIDLVVAPLY